MDAWIPFFQSLIWPVFLAILLFFARDWVKKTLEVIKKRIETGSEMSIGPGGLTLGSAPRLEPEISGEDALLEKVVAKDAKREPLAEVAPSQLAQALSLIHGATYDPEYSKRRGKPYYSIQVQLSASNPAILDKVSKVVYHLHPTFQNPVREKTNRDESFELRTKAWGQFNLRADVYLKGREQPLTTLYRYLNF